MVYKAYTGIKKIIYILQLNWRNDKFSQHLRHPFNEASYSTFFKKLDLNCYKRQKIKIWESKAYSLPDHDT